MRPVTVTGQVPAVTSAGCHGRSGVIGPARRPNACDGSGVLEHVAPYVALTLALVVGGVVSPVPEEAAIIGAGLATANGWLSPVPAAVALVIGVVLGDVCIFALGGLSARGARSLGVRPSEAMLRRASDLVGRWGLAAVVAARFVPGLRGAVFFVAGATGASIRSVAAVDLAAAAVHVPLLLALGALVQW